jgi:hypothetical protein
VAQIGPPDYRGWPRGPQGPKLAALIAVMLVGIFVPAVGITSSLWLDILVGVCILTVVGLATWGIAERRERRRRHGPSGS